MKYVQEAEELIRPERNTLLVSFTELEGFNQELATTIQEEYYRWVNTAKLEPGRKHSVAVFAARTVLLIVWCTVHVESLLLQHVLMSFMNLYARDDPVDHNRYTSQHHHR